MAVGGFYFSEVTRLARDLEQVPTNAGPKIYQAVEQTSLKIKSGWSGKLAGSRSFPGAAASIGFDIGNNESLLRNTFLGGGASQVTSVIGAKVGGVGSLVFVSEFGALSTAPRGYGAGALQENAADFEQGLAKAIEDAEREAGL